MARNSRSDGRTNASSNRPNGQNRSSTAIVDRPHSVSGSKLSIPTPRPADAASTTNSPTPSSAATASPRSPVTIPVSHEQIAMAAYNLWKQRGGTAEQNWMDAEAQLRKQAQL